jgi:hypothetical protein
MRGVFLRVGSVLCGLSFFIHEARTLTKSIEETTLPVGTAFHERTFPLCQSLNYREWSGYYAVSVYEVHHEHEYNAIRNAAALIDITPLYKYLITGKDVPVVNARASVPCGRPYTINRSFASDLSYTSSGSCTTT